MTFPPLRVSSDGHHIQQADGAPFFYLADTGWELLQRLNREEIELYFDDRAAKGFTAVQVMALAEQDGLRAPNAYGRVPLKRNTEGDYDPRLPDLDGEYSYWDHLDYALSAAAERGLYLALLPVWGDKFNRMWGIGPEIFTPENAFDYGLWLGTRYRKTPNIIWVLGGDRPLLTRRHFDIVNGMAMGLAQGDGGCHLKTFHPTGAQSSSLPLHGEAWLDFNMIQSGHTRTRFNYKMIAADYALVPPKPVLDGEPGYENHPENFNLENGLLDDADARQFAWMSVLSGACGHTYGNHCVWTFKTEGPVPTFESKPYWFCQTWKKAVHTPGAGQMHILKDLVLALDFLSGRPAPELIANQMEGVMHIPALKTDAALIAYTAAGRPVRLVPEALAGRSALAKWIDPRTGEETVVGPVSDGDATEFAPPSAGRGHDWALALIFQT